MGILDGKRILVAGVTMDSSIGFATAKIAQEQGATRAVAKPIELSIVTPAPRMRLPSRIPMCVCS